MVRILITDDHAVLRSGLRLLLDREDDLEVVGEATSAEEALGAVLAQPDGPKGPVDELSPREREVLRLLALGYTNQEIAEMLVVSVRTVESHRAHVMTKLRAGSRAAMVRHALAAGLLDDEREAEAGPG